MRLRHPANYSKFLTVFKKRLDIYCCLSGVLTWWFYQCRLWPQHLIRLSSPIRVDKRVQWVLSKRFTGTPIIGFLPSTVFTPPFFDGFHSAYLQGCLFTGTSVIIYSFLLAFLGGFHLVFFKEIYGHGSMVFIQPFFMVFSWLFLMVFTRTIFKEI